MPIFFLYFRIPMVLSVRCTKANVVAVGHFNPAIVTPPWLSAEGLLNAGQAEIDQIIGPTGMAMRFRMEGFIWSVGLDRFTLDAENPAEMAEAPAGLMRGILERLPHTPLRAIGLNFAYEPDGEGGVFGFSVDGRTLQDVAEALNSQLAAADMKIVLADERGVQVQVVLKRGPDQGRIVDTNFHRPVNTIDQALAALDAVAEDHQRAIRIARWCLEFPG